MSNLLSLEQNPHLHAAQWRRQYIDILRALHISAQPNGMLAYGFHLPPATTELPHPDNIKAVPTTPDEPSLTGASNEWTSYAIRLKAYTSYQKDYSEARTIGLVSLGSTITKALMSPTDGMGNVTIHDLFQHVSLNYGAATVHSLDNLNSLLHQPILSPAVFPAAVAEYAFVHRQLADLGQTKCEYDKITAMETAAASHPSLVQALHQYHISVPKVSERTFAATVKYVLDNIGNYATLGHSGFAGAATPMSRTQEQRIVEAVTAALASSTATSISPNKPKSTSTRPPADPSAPANPHGSGKSYCYVHGFQPTHTGMKCLVMRGNPAFTDAQKAATHP